MSVYLHSADENWIVAVFVTVVMLVPVAFIVYLLFEIDALGWLVVRWINV